jgi:tetratricopeptide (TPR) repeat protein
MEEREKSGVKSSQPVQDISQGQGNLQKHGDNFLEASVVNEMLQNIEQLEARCKGQMGEEVVEMRIRALAYSKILCNVYGRDVTHLIRAYTNLAISYLDISYFEQAQEHLIQAFKLNENLNEDLSLSNKEYQIKILINLAKCYMENDKLPAGLAICQKSLKMNQTLFGEDHVSNADIFYVLAKVNSIKINSYSFFKIFLIFI